MTLKLSKFLEVTHMEKKTSNHLVITINIPPISDEVSIIFLFAQSIYLKFAIKIDA